MAFLSAEETFLASQGKKSPRTYKSVRPTHGVLAEALRRNNVDYFNYILTDEMEREFWLLFLTGKQVQRDVNGHPVMQEVVDEEGQTRLVPVLEDVELNPISAKMFLRAVEYKRGQPISIDPDKDKDKKVTVVFETIGASAEFFRDTGRATGLIKE